LSIARLNGTRNDNVGHRKLLTCLAVYREVTAEEHAALVDLLKRQAGEVEEFLAAIKAKPVAATFRC
jgi:hypothetical protein